MKHESYTSGLPAEAHGFVDQEAAEFEAGRAQARSDIAGAYKRQPGEHGADYLARLGYTCIDFETEPDPGVLWQASAWPPGMASSWNSSIRRRSSNGFSAAGRSRS